MRRKIVVFVMIDGVGDVCLPELGHRTPLQVANIPNLDRLARFGLNGLMDPVEPGLACGSDTAHLSIFGYDPRLFYRGRGAFECMGAGLDMDAGDIAFKSNFATWDIDSNIVISRRADRNFESLGPDLCAAIDGACLPSFPHHSVSVKYATEHRCGVRLRGPNLSDCITGTDPLKDGRPLVLCEPTTGYEGDDNALLTCKLIQELHHVFYNKLVNHPINIERVNKGKSSANCVLLRGAGIKLSVPTFAERYGLSAFVVAPTCIIAGLGASVGMDIVQAPGATGDYLTNLSAKVDAAVNAFLDQEKNYSFGFVHVKAVDDAGHDFRIDLKIQFIEKIDTMIGELELRLMLALSDTDISFVVTGDHSTPVRSGDHSYEPVPFVFTKLSGSNIPTPDSVVKFDEISAANGLLHRFPGSQVMPFICNNM